MWTSITLTSNQNKLTFQLQEDNTSISYQRFLTLMSGNEAFIKWYNQLMADSSFDSFFWENRPVTKHTLDELYECTLVKSRRLSGVQPDSSTFDFYFSPDSDVVTFPNLGGDARLIVPCPDSDTPESVYTQIGSFIRNAPEHQVSNFWQRVGQEMLDHIQQEPRWLSTSGLGVYWLHARIDSVPKYYQTEAYKQLS